MSMNIKKWNPTNWFKHEEKERAGDVPVRRDLPADSRGLFPVMTGRDPISNLHQEIDRIFNNMFLGSSLGHLPEFFGGKKLNNNSASNLLLKPSMDIKERKKDYKITVEIPGVEEDDIKLELADGALIVSGEKKYEKEDKDEHYYSVERSYGSFRRVLSLPEDADESNIDAKFKNGVLNITVARKAIEKPSNMKQIEIKKAA